MATRLPSLLDRPVGFVSRACLRSWDRLSAVVALDAAGLSDGLWIAEDGKAVLNRSPRLSGLRPRRRTAAQSERLGRSPLRLSELRERCGGDFDLMLDVGSPEAIQEAAAPSRGGGGGEALGRVWLSSRDLAVLSEWRERWGGVRLVYSVQKRRISGGLERLAAQLAERGIDAVGMTCEDWTGGTAALFHRFGILAVGWGAHHEPVIMSMLDAGLDALVGGDPDLLFACITRRYPIGQNSSPPPEAGGAPSVLGGFSDARRGHSEGPHVAQRPDLEEGRADDAVE